MSFQHPAVDVLKFEHQAKQKGFSFILGVDEAGRGPLAGPVVAAAVALKSYDFETSVRDSKQLSAAQREKAFQEICHKAHVGVGIINETVIDDINILQATFVAMTNAVWQLWSRIPGTPEEKKALQQQAYLLVDGNRFKTDLPFAHETIVDGDALSLSISSASIVAKVVRDRILKVYHQILPQYGFMKHKGYPTREHKLAIQKYGLSFIHRRSFRNVF